jgi:hypothetical protein
MAFRELIRSRMKKSAILLSSFVFLVSIALPAAAQMRAQAAGSGAVIRVVPPIEGGILPSAGTLSNSFTPLGLNGSLAAPSAPTPLLSAVPTAPSALAAPAALAVTAQAAAVSGKAATILPTSNAKSSVSSYSPVIAPVHDAGGRIVDSLAVRPAAAVSFDGERERTRLVDAADVPAASGEHAPLTKAPASAPSQADRTPAPPSAPEAPRAPGFGAGRILGALLIGLSFIPTIAGIAGFAGASFGTLPLIVGASLLLPGLFLGFRSAPVKDPFYLFLAMAGGFFGGGSLTSALTSGNPGNAWILTALYGMTALGMMGVDLMKGRVGGSSGARQTSSWIAFGGYIAGVIMMIGLKDWHNGVGVLLGLGVATGVGFVSLVLPPLLDKLKALLTRGGSSAGGAAKGPDARWNFLARDPRVAVWGGGIIGALLSGAVLLFGLTAVSALFSIAFAAPVLGVGAGYWLHLYAKRRAGL